MDAKLLQRDEHFGNILICGLCVGVDGEVIPAPGMNAIIDVRPAFAKASIAPFYKMTSGKLAALVIG